MRCERCEQRTVKYYYFTEEAAQAEEPAEAPEATEPAEAPEAAEPAEAPEAPEVPEESSEE